MVLKRLADALHDHDHILAVIRGAVVSPDRGALEGITRMSVLENLIVAQHNRLMRASLFSIAGLLGLARYRTAEAEAVAGVRLRRGSL